MDHDSYMKLAIEMAKRTKGQTSPNPMVGAVVVKNGEVVGLGAHLKAGEGHAEVHALEAAGAKAKGATMYVTLEPCSHHGQTPPCANLVIEKGITTVYVATLDPNPLVAGKGIERLRNAGVHVHVGLHELKAVQLNPFFNHYMVTNLPFVTVKVAASLDGKTATKTGHSKWITGEEARLDVHHHRHEHDAILVGVNTIIQDDPSLTTRLPMGGKNPVRIVLDTNARVPLDARVLNDEQAKTWIVTGSSAPKDNLERIREKGARIVTLGQEKITIKPLLNRLGEAQINSLFVEGGATVHASFIQERCVQQFITYMAPLLIGGKSAPSMIGGLGVEKVGEAAEFTILSVQQMGKDLKIISQLKEEESCLPGS